MKRILNFKVNWIYLYIYNPRIKDMRSYDPVPDLRMTKQRALTYIVKLQIRNLINS